MSLRTSVSGVAVRCFLVVGILFVAVPLQAQWWNFGRKTTASMGKFSSDYPYQKSLAPYVSTPMPAIDQMLDLAKLKPGETLYDLGCGDGRILVEAAVRYHAKAVGVEISHRLAKQAAENVKSRNLQDQVQVIHGDMMQVDLTGANVVTLYLSTTANETLRPNLERYLRPNTRVVSYDFPIAGWHVIQEAQTGPGSSGITHTIYVYQIPASMKQ
jgi:SAM-dependent methyltransferase